MKENFFGKKMRARRKELGFTLRDVAQRASLSVAHVSDLETGRRQPYPVGKMALICKILDLDFPEMRRLAALDAMECKLPLSGMSKAAIEFALVIFSEWPVIDTDKARKALAMIDAENASKDFPEKLVIEEDNGC